MNVAFWVSIIGDRFSSSVSKSTLNVRDLFAGIDVRYWFSLIWEATILGVSNLITLLRVTGSYPWSMNDVSLPPALVPVIVLILDVTLVPLPGVITLIIGSRELNW